MRFDRLDLNLLVALEALTEERSVSAAAVRLHLSQSAMSGSLARLREYFKDDLLVPNGREMTPTQAGLELGMKASEALLLIRSTITTPQKFDPKTSDRKFFIVASDYMYDTLLARALHDVTSVAPGLRFELAAPDGMSSDCFLRGEVDLFITLEQYAIGEHPSVHLCEDNLAVVSWMENPRTQAGIDIDLLSDLPHVTVVFGAERRPAFAETAVAAIAIKRRVMMQVQNFNAVPAAIVGTDRISIMNYLHAQHFARNYPLRVSPLPVAVPPLREIIHWHRMRVHDEGIQWLVQQLVEAAQSATADRPASP